MPKNDECVSTSAASPFYTSPGRQPFGQVVRRRLGKARTEPSATLTATLSGQQPFSQVVRGRFAHVWTDPSSSLSSKRRGHTPLITRTGLHHQLSWTRHLLHAQHVANTSDRVPNPFLGCRGGRSLGDRGSNGESLAFQPSFDLLASRPCHPAPRLPLSTRPRPGLDGRGQNRAAPTIEILSKSSSILRWQGWWLVPRQTASPHGVIRSPEARAFFIRLVGTRR